ncbi:hypothetical protein [Lacticaseibacillus absianus]|uniref:hypothetical protein n=1 Tax=Lacticaseibacillus absianus TaxID=2729623 RepID=UPI0015CDBA5E|nr:hypothetical protein [Lacticaseibacillus absianus]
MSRKTRHTIAKVIKTIWYTIMAAGGLFMLLVIVAKLIEDPVATLGTIAIGVLVGVVFLGGMLLMEWLES